MYENNFFKITERDNQDRLVLNLENPFNETMSNNITLKTDLRVPYLVKIIEKVLQKQWADYNFLEKHIELWNKIEQKRNHC